MGLHREPIIGGLYPEGFADPLNLRSHTTLILERLEVLNHGIAESDVEAAVVKLSKICRVSGDRRDVLVQLFLGKQVQADYLNISTASPASIFPELVHSPNIENA